MLSLSALRSMLSLADLATVVDGELQNSTGTHQISDICYDSRKAKSGDIFVAISGHKDDGIKYVQDALRRGACGAIVESSIALDIVAPTILVSDTRVALAQAAWALAGNPQKKLKLIGVTGTNGKTTVTSALAQLLNRFGRSTGVCGTLGMNFDNFQFASDRTTAEAPELAAAFTQMLNHGATHVALEATSIGLALHRLDELQFEVAVFTNLSRDHLDFHGTWEDYRTAKLKLFESISQAGTAVINSDDPESSHFLSHTARPTLTYSIENVSNYRATDIELRANGTSFLMQCDDGDYQVQTSLIGRFNVYNTLAIIASAYAMGLTLEEVIRGVRNITPVRGRAEVIESSAPFAVLVDYAHTPDALEKILSTLRELTRGKLHCVIGAGGDRDRGKRPLMAKAAAQFSDFVYFTSDNPRSEEPQEILNDMRIGLADSSNLYMNVDRRSAIFEALDASKSGDVVVVAGKGHESYQEILGIKHAFDDAEVIRDWLRTNGFLK